MASLIHLIIEAFWFILPAYFANGAPVVLGGGPPIDGGRRFWDNRRIFGDGKTIRGFLVGLLIGTGIGGLQELSGETVGLSGHWKLGFLLALGAMLGDSLASFAKRRAKLRRGQPAPILDQLDFIAGAFLLGSIIKVPRWEIIAFILIVTPSIHFATNFIAYKLGYKSEPY